MNIPEYIYYITYFIVGIILTTYWWITKHQYEYKEAKESGELQYSAFSYFIMLSIFAWPLMIVVKIIAFINIKILKKYSQHKNIDKILK